MGDCPPANVCSDAALYEKGNGQKDPAGFPADAI